MNLWIILYCFITFPLVAKGLQGILQGAPCIKCRYVTGCKSEKADKTLFFLYTKNNPEDAECLHQCRYRLPNNTNFKPCNRTVLIIHGFVQGACREAWMREMKDQFLKRWNCNVIIVDYTWCNFPDYTSAARHCAPIVTSHVAEIILNIMNATNCTADTFYIVGLSLGAHISGFAAKIVYQKSGQKVGRITGLDPAIYPFQNTSCENRLCWSDANLVDSIHTGSGHCVALHFGDMNPLGHADFYVNGGQYQSACYHYGIESILKGDLIYGIASLLLPQYCHHTFSQQLFKVSINPCKCQFIGVKLDDYNIFTKTKIHNCRKDNCQVMGLDFERYWNGINTTNNKYFVETTPRCPYCNNSNINFDDFPVGDGPCF